MPVSRSICLTCSLLLSLLSLGTSAEAQYIKTNVASFSTSSTTFTNVTGGTLTFTPSNSSDIWILLVNARLMSTQIASFTRSAEARYLVNGVEHGIGGILNSAANKGASWQHFYRVTGTTAMQTVQVQLRDDSAATATIADLQIIAFLLPTGTDFQYTETEAIQAVPSPWTTYESLSFTPSAPGTYLIMALANGTEDPGTGGIGIRLEDPSLSFWPDNSSGGRLGHLSNTRIPWQSYFLARSQILTATPQTYTLQATGDAGAGSQLRYTRLMAFRTDALDSFETVEDTAITSTTSTTPVVRSVLTTAAPPSARDYIVIQSLVLSGTSSLDENRAGFETDDVVKMSYDHVFNGSFHFTSFGFFDALTSSGAVKYENTFSTSNGASAVEAKESVIHVLRLPPPATSYRSIGTNTGILYDVGDASITAGTKVVTFAAGASLPLRGAVGAVGRGDQLVIGGETFFILSRDSATQVTVQTAAAGTHTNEVYTITRAYNTFQAWENAREGDLVAENRREVGVAYDDGPFAAGVTFVSSITDALHYMHLTVAVGQRHDGTAGTGVVLDGANTPQSIRLEDDFTVVEWLEIKRVTGAGAPAAIVADAANLLIAHLLIHDFFDPAGAVSGIRALNSGTSYTVRNSIIYDGDAFGIRNQGTIGVIQNTTIYGMTDSGVGVHGSGTVTVTNTISLGNSSLAFQNLDTMTGSHNMSDDATAFSVFASDPNAITGATSANEFVDDTFTTADLHLKLGAQALEAGTDLSPAFIIDIDAQIRPWGAQWDMGADERPTASSCPVTRQAWFDQDWLFRKAVVVQSSQVTAVLRDFPVLINLASDTELAADAQNDGDDIVFTSSDGVTKLSHEIEKFVGATGELVAWVKVPYLSSGADTAIYMYYGNGTVGNQEDVANVWDADYRGVWHLDEAVTDETTAGTHLDSTSSANNGSQDGNDDIPGKVGTGQDFDGNDFINLGTGFPPVGATFTIEGWVWFDSFASNPTIFARQQFTNLDYRVVRDSGLRIDISYDGSEPGDAAASAPTAVSTGQWYHFAAVKTTSNLTMYLDGAAGTPTATAGTVNYNASLENRMSIRMDGSQGLDGRLDELRVSAIPRSADWIQTEFNNENSPATFYTVCSATTEVELVSFEAVGLDGAVELFWETGSELNNLGFHLHRSSSERGSYERITAQAIPGLGSSPVGAKYSYRDTGLTNGVTYYYKLEDIETTGKTEFHGPVPATPTAGAASTGGNSGDGSSDSGSSGSSSGEEGATSLITYGDPSANTLRVLRRGRGQVVLELETEGFYAVPQEDGSVRLEIPGFEALTETNAPGIPVKRSWVEALAGRKVKLVSVTARRVEAFTGLRPSDAEVAEMVATPEGTVRAARRRAREAFREDGLSPSSAARLVSVGFQGEDKKALVELAPLRWDESRGQLLLARRLVVRLSFREREPSELSTDGVRGRRYAKKPSHDQHNVVAHLLTTERGLHSVRYEDVMRGRRGVRAKTLRMSRQGETVTFHLEPSSRRFKPGSTLYFMSEGASSNPYGSEAVYELEVGRFGDAGESMPEISAAPSGEPIRVYWHRAEWEENRYYQAALLEAPDLWLWDLLFAPAVKSYPFEVSALALRAPSEASHLSVWLQGVSDFRANPDHHVRVSVNGSLVADVSWDGKRAKKIDVDLWPGLLQEGDNVLELENVGDTEAAYSMVMLDRYALEHPRVALTDDGRLDGRWSESGTAELSGLVPGTHVLDVSGAQPSWLLDTEVGADGMLRFRAESGRSYLAVSPEAVYHPTVTKPRASRLKNTRHRADYLVIGPEAFLRAAIPLLELRQSEGLKVKAVSIEEVYAEFGFGEPTPEAVKDFLSYAYHHWRQPSPRYVLLLGDATFDFKDHLQTGVTNQVPPRMVKTSYLWTASDPSYAAVNGEDILPDFSIGRLPAATVEEIQAMVEKIVAYETGEAGLHRSAVVLVADNSDRAGNFEADADALAATVLASKNPEKIYLSRLGTAATRNAIVQSFDEGASLMSYLGHGGIHLWASENFFNRRDVASLGLQSQQPLLLTMNCLNGYFHFPYFNSLAEELIKAREKGAIAAFSPSGLSLNGPANLYHQALLQELFNGSHERLGDAVLAAQVAYAETGASAV